MRRAENRHWLRNPANLTGAAWQAFKSLLESNLKIGIYSHCGGLDIAPSAT
jgi:hypothetical protein